LVPSSRTPTATATGSFSIFFASRTRSQTASRYSTFSVSSLRSRLRQVSYWSCSPATTRDTVLFDSGAPFSSGFSANFTRRVLVPDRYNPISAASTSRVRRA
jgi:hypothetical protein